MNNNIKLIIALVVIAVIYFLTTRDSSSSDFDKNFTNIDTENISKIEITKDSTITLVKENNQWMVDNYNANQDFVNSALDEAKNIKLARKVSSNPEKHSKYEVDKGTKIVLHGDEETSFILGKTASSFQNVFIRKTDEDDVFTTAKNFKSKFEKSIADWKDKSILSISKDAIASIVINENLFLTNLDSVVQVKGIKGSEPLADGNSSATSMFSKFSSLKTVAFPKVDVTNQKILFNVKINQRAGEVNELSFYEKAGEDSKYYLTVKDNPTLFEVNSSSFDVFTKNYDELIK
ncbi:MAG: DUF4340 domain-containing protein [Calditrichaeota bacterium]|nr:MAG: DUF4340 domain-containing protein [Calditrichota bacterium]MBL1205175.1 DUF4340 domain-containing protein [Calditrichota bacterium]NOG45005.1 DUF4340 domain-containing protein [Calditrichota bacterium]